MEYKLSIRQRIVLLSILPEQGDLLSLRIVRQLREDLSFSEAEQADCQLVSDAGQVRWKEGAVPDKAIDIGPKGQEVVRTALKKLDDDKALRLDQLDLCDLFEYGK
jgi:hypothetical protein